MIKELKEIKVLDDLCAGHSGLGAKGGDEQRV